MYIYAIYTVSVLVYDTEDRAARPKRETIRNLA